MVNILNEFMQTNVAFNKDVSCKDKDLHGACAFTGRYFEETYMTMSYPVENQNPAIKESPILPRCHGHIVEETEAKSLQSINLTNSTMCLNMMEQF